MKTLRILQGILLHPLRSRYYKNRRRDYLDLQMNAYYHARKRFWNAQENAEMCATTKAIRRPMEDKARYEEIYNLFRY